MTREFVYTRTFFNNWKAVGLNDDDLARFETMLLENPKMGAVIQGTGRARKVRFAYSGEGKSGSVRVIYADFEIGEKICGLTVYTKSEKDSLTAAEKHNIKNILEILEIYYDKQVGKEV